MPLPNDPDLTPQHVSREATSRAFGAENRARLLNRYFEGTSPVTPTSAWKHVYRLLLWIDRTTGLAHCYESDKAQPGRAWYARSLAFHDWVSDALGSTPTNLGENIDWLFQAAIADLATKVIASRTVAYEEQRAPYEGRGFPEPGDDPELVGIIREILGPWFGQPPPADELRRLTQRIYLYMNQENKRRNLVGEGFEDVVAAILLRVCDPLEIRSRALLHELPGFHPPPPNEKAKRVDLALISKRQRHLVTVKWSIRADREEQFQSDFEAYARLESAGQDFAYTLITNEFDAARLKAACERRRQNALLFTHVVHINPAGVLAAYGDASRRGASPAIKEHVESGRLIGLDGWLSLLGSQTQ
jgi:hypothetical protein